MTVTQGIKRKYQDLDTDAEDDADVEVSKNNKKACTKQRLILEMYRNWFGMDCNMDYQFVRVFYPCVDIV